MEYKIIDYTFNLDKKTLIFFNSSKNAFDLTTDDFFSIDDIISKEDGDKIKFSNLTIYKYKKAEKTYDFSDIKNKWTSFDILVEVVYKKHDRLKYNNVIPRETESVKVMTYDYVDFIEESNLQDFGDEKRLNKFETLIIKPKKVIVTKIDKSGGLIDIINQFKRDKKLDELGI